MFHLSSSLSSSHFISTFIFDPPNHLTRQVRQNYSFHKERNKEAERRMIWSRSLAQRAPILPSSHSSFLFLPSLWPLLPLLLCSWDPKRACLTQFCLLALKSITANKSARCEGRKGWSGHTKDRLGSLPPKFHLAHNGLDLYR